MGNVNTNYGKLGLSRSVNELFDVIAYLYTLN